MSKFIKTQTVKTNKKGKVIETILNIQPKKGFVHINEVNELYNKIKQTKDPKNIMIKVHTATGFLTAKSFNYSDDDLELLIDNYYSSMSKDGQKKFKNLLSFQIITK